MVSRIRQDDQRSAPARGSHYWPGLDGMRAIAILAVVVYHLAPSVLPGGFLGVDLFFVISGYLITTLVTEEWRKRGRVDLIAFWGRRIRRLYPAILALIAVIVPVTAIFDPRALADSRVTILMALFYMTNWWFIFHHVPYFQTFGPRPLFVNLWSLAIEEQYYLIWPPILVLALRRWRRPLLVAAGALAGAVASALLMGVLYHGPGSLGLVYYGTDTHAEGLLLGSALGLAVPPTGFPRRVGDEGRRILERAVAVALAGLVALMFLLGQADTFTWRGGLLLAVCCAGVAVVVAAHPATRVGALLSVPPLRWLGTRSYSIYLWHWPIIVLTERQGVLALSGFPGLVLRLALIAGFAEASYRYVEQPWRRGDVQRALRRLLARDRRSRWTVASTSGMAVLAVTLLVVLASAPPLPEASGPSATPAAEVAPSRVHIGGAGSGGHTASPDGGTPVGRPDVSLPAGVVPARGDGPLPVPDGAVAPVAPPGPGPRAGGPVLAIGDSVMLAAAPDLEAAFGPKITVDAVVGRQPYTGLDRLAEYKAAGRLRGLRALLIGLGSNGYFTPSDLTRLRGLAAGVPLVVMVNVRVPDPWGAQSDAVIDAAARLPGFKVVDWYRASAAPGVLYPDGVHPDPAGQALYTRLVVDAVTGR